MHYFLHTNGSKGAFSFGTAYPVIKLYGYPASVMHEVAEKLMKEANSEGVRAEVVHCCMDNSIKGLLFPDIKKGVMNVAAYEDSGLLQAIDTGAPEAAVEIKRAYSHFKDALLIHDEWERYYIDNFNFKALDAECVRLCDEILQDRKASEGGIIRDRFLGAATAYGSVDYIKDITDDVKRRCFIKGRPGTGKSTFLKKIINAAAERGFAVERYHCSFDPNSIDMLVIRSLSVCVFDSTAPHEHFPVRNGDEIIDFYEIAAERNIDREFKAELAGVAASYKEKINMATDCIARANNIYKRIESAYAGRINATNLEEYIEDIKTEIFG